MGTTLALDRTTLQMLKDLKKEMRARSLEEVVRRLVTQQKKVPASMFGAFRKNPIPHLTREEKREFDKYG